MRATLTPHTGRLVVISFGQPETRLKFFGDGWALTHQLVLNRQKVAEGSGDGSSGSTHACSRKASAYV